MIGRLPYRRGRKPMSSLDEFHNKKPVHIWPITLLRIYTGVFFLKFGWGKITNPNFVDGLAGFVSLFAGILCLGLLPRQVCLREFFIYLDLF